MKADPISRGGRVWLAIASGFLVVGFAAAAWLTPSDAAFGTHRQFGLPPCGVLVWTGTPCPSCGLTTSITNVMHGRFAAAWNGQPVGVLVVLASAIAMLVCTDAAIRGRWRLPISPLATAVSAIWIINAVAIARWLVVYKL